MDTVDISEPGKLSFGKMTCIEFDLISRTFRGTTYQIRVDNSAHVQQGIKKAQMDGQELPVTPDGRVILPDCSRETAQVVITLGR